MTSTSSIARHRHSAWVAGLAAAAIAAGVAAVPATAHAAPAPARPQVVLSAPGVVAEGTGGVRQVTVLAQVKGSNTHGVRLYVAPAIGTGAGTAAYGRDWRLPAGYPNWLTIAPGVLSAAFRVSITTDAVEERDETANLLVSSPDALVQNGGRRTILIADDDRPRLRVTGVSVSEGTSYAIESGAFRLRKIRVSLSRPVNHPVRVSVRTLGGTATPGRNLRPYPTGDYLPVQATVTIPARRTTADVGVWVVADRLRERNETIRFLATSVLANPPAPSAVNPYAVGVMTLLNDD